MYTAQMARICCDDLRLHPETAVALPLPPLQTRIYSVECSILVRDLTSALCELSGELLERSCRDAAR